MPLRSRFAASLMALVLAAPAAQAVTLHVLHVNDTHSRIQSVTKTNSTCSDEDEANGACSAVPPGSRPRSTPPARRPGPTR